MIGIDDERELGNFMLSAQFDDVDDINIYIYIYTHTRCTYRNSTHCVNDYCINLEKRSNS